MKQKECWDDDDDDDADDDDDHDDHYDYGYDYGYCYNCYYHYHHCFRTSLFPLETGTGWHFLGAAASLVGGKGAGKRPKAQCDVSLWV